jgi:hypothetical protein
MIAAEVMLLSELNFTPPGIGQHLQAAAAMVLPTMSTLHDSSSRRSFPQY